MEKTLTISNMSPIFGYISTTDAKAIHTLHVVYSSQITDSTGESSFTEVRDFYIKNLSHDANRAHETAQELCLLYNIPLKSIDDFNINDIVKVTNISKIDRDAQDRIVVEQRTQIESEHENLFQQAIERNVFIVGQYSGKTAGEVYTIDPDYVKSIAKQYISGDSSSFQVNAKLAKDFIEENNITFGGFVGEVGETVTVDLTLKSGYVTQGRFTTIIWTALTEDGKVIKFFSTAAGFKALKDGDKFKVTGTVKEHSNYHGKESTLLNRPKLVK